MSGKHIPTITATDLIFMAAKQRGKPITSDDLKDSDIMHDLVREESLLPHPEHEFKDCKNYCKSNGRFYCHCQDVGGL